MNREQVAVKFLHGVEELVVAISAGASPLAMRVVEKIVGFAVEVNLPGAVWSLQHFLAVIPHQNCILHDNFHKFKHKFTHPQQKFQIYTSKFAHH